MERLDFDEVTNQFEQLSTKAKATLMFKLVQVAGPAVLRTIIRYAFGRLDIINSELPEEHPYKRFTISTGVYVEAPINLHKTHNHDRNNKIHSESH